MKPKSFYTQTVEKKDNATIKNIHEIKSLMRIWKLLINNSNLYPAKNNFITQLYSWMKMVSDKAKILMLIGEESTRI